MKDIYATLATFLTQLKKLHKKHRNHPSISIIKKMISTVDKNEFSFEPIIADDISQQMKRLNINKATQESDIATKLVKA